MRINPSCAASPPTTMLGNVPGSIRVARLLGIDVRIHFSWFLIFFIVVLSLADSFAAENVTWSDTKSFIIAVIAAALFFLSVLLHELAHALVARRFRMSVSSITLFVLGGVANLSKEPPSAMSEFLMAAAGPGGRDPYRGPRGPGRRRAPGGRRCRARVPVGRQDQRTLARLHRVLPLER